MQKKLILKIVVIFVIGLILLIPLMMIDDKIAERQGYLAQAKQTVAQNWTGHQRLITPILVVPYITERSIRFVNKENNTSSIKKSTKSVVKLFTATNLKIDASLNTQVRYKGIYKVPVYNASIAVSGSFERQEIQKTLASIRNLPGFKHFSTPYLSTVVSDSRGISNIPTLKWDKQSINFVPGSRLKLSGEGLHAALSFLTLSSGNNKSINFSYQLDLRGMERLDFVPIAAQSEVKLHSNWAHPSFVGEFLPVQREVSDEGYTAQWIISSFANNIAQKLNQCAQGECAALVSANFGVKQIEPVSIYVQAERSVKYGVLFIGLSFIAFFIFEIINKLAIHAIQYTLVGSSIAIFYLLLISLSEHIAFALAYFIATLSCIGLLFYYLSYILRGYKDALFFSALLGILFAVLYVIISAEDFALLMGAVFTFITLALVMICTRNIDWYDLVEVEVEVEVDVDKRQLTKNITTTEME